MLVNPLQPEKAERPISVMLEGMVTSVKPLQPIKTPSIEVIPKGIVTLVKLIQFSKAPSPIEVTLEGIVTLVKLLQPEKVLLVDSQCYTL